VSERYDLNDAEEAEKGIAAAITALRAGELVVMPTDTVYGIAADAFDRSAVSRLQEAKGRGRESPPPVLVGSVAALDGLADDIDHNTRDLVERFWPGGLSLVLTQQPSLSWDLGDTKGTVMLRMPNHDMALQLLRRVGPLAVSSANKHGRPPATSVDVAEAELGDDVAVYLDGGETPGPSPSTMVDMTRVVPQLLRRGVVSESELREVLSLLEVDIDGEPAFPDEDDDTDEADDLTGESEEVTDPSDEDEAAPGDEPDEDEARREASDEDESPGDESDEDEAQDDEPEDDEPADAEQAAEHADEEPGDDEPADERAEPDEPVEFGDSSGSSDENPDEPQAEPSPTEQTGADQHQAEQEESDRPSGT